MNSLPTVLTIAGSDSGGGAGIQADLKTIAMLGGFGASVLTALTAQNTRGVDAIHAPPPPFVAQQLKTVLSDIRFQAVKTGMLFSAPIIKSVSPFLKKMACPVVVDPVCVAQSGHKLLEDSAVEAMVESIFPHAAILTPNLPEAEMFAGMPVKTGQDIANAGKKLLKMGPKAVLIKGGHDEESVAVTDWLCLPGQKPLPLMMPRVNTTNNHGTGCTLSAAIATYLAHGLELPKAVRAAQRYLNLALRTAWDLGKGAGPPNHSAPLMLERQRCGVLAELSRGGRLLEDVDGLADRLDHKSLNLALAMPDADEAADVACFDAPMTADVHGRVRVRGCPVYGANLTATAALLSARRVRPDVHCLLDLHGAGGLAEDCEQAGLKVARFNRAKMGRGTKPDEASVLDWGVYKSLMGDQDADLVHVVSEMATGGRSVPVFLLARDVDEMLNLALKALSKRKKG